MEKKQSSIFMKGSKRSSMKYSYIVTLYPNQRKPEEYYFEERSFAENFLNRCKVQQYKAELQVIEQERGNK